MVTGDGMHYKLKFYDMLFQNIVQFHLEEGSSFKDFEVESTLGHKLLFRRIRNDGVDKMSWEIRISHETVEITADLNVPGYDIKINKILDYEWKEVSLDDPRAVFIASRCCAVFVRLMEDQWYV
ncbi:hypothetical protein AVT69_gp283 [Pseudomonas phage PhiPA3]|uniref:Uncharacterized protein 285 n=1 Tax=Pseudomonas phage PhiPA3 TaxID=998086 RepID=F8SJC1_BPPA3|nr:hypothetical protein AVT69_gp283 [Pseudomonas phage PhiPA3]AEH03708.1 hypothetical protein [Pseudomonas phage PhiPA3]